MAVVSHKVCVVALTIRKNTTIFAIIAIDGVGEKLVVGVVCPAMFLSIVGPEYQKIHGIVNFVVRP
jgi:hypothetical protein